MYNCNVKNLLKFLVILILINLQVLFVSIFFELIDHKHERQDKYFNDDFQRVQKLSNYFQPDHKTAIILPKNLQRREIVSFVLSSPNSKESRQNIRNTWSSILYPIFLIGIDQNNASATFEEIKAEAETYDDIIMENVIDTYKNLTLKTGFAMKNFINYFNESSYFMKIDYDYVNMNVTYLVEIFDKSAKDALIGSMLQNTSTKRDVKSNWFVSKSEYKNETEHPNILRGSLFLIPGKFIHSIFHEILEMKYVRLEDVFYTGIVLNEKLILQLYHVKGLYFDGFFNQSH
jgi:hypothetical protein